MDINVNTHTHTHKQSDQLSAQPQQPVPPHQVAWSSISQAVFPGEERDTRDNSGQSLAPLELEALQNMVCFGFFLTRAELFAQDVRRVCYTQTLNYMEDQYQDSRSEAKHGPRSVQTQLGESVRSNNTAFAFSIDPHLVWLHQPLPIPRLTQKGINFCKTRYGFLPVLLVTRPAHLPLWRRQSIDLGRTSFSLFLDEDLNDLPPLLLQNVDQDITSLFQSDMGS